MQDARIAMTGKESLLRRGPGASRRGSTLSLTRLLLTIAAAFTLVSLAVLARSGPPAAAYSNPPTIEIQAKLYDAAVARNIPPEILYGIAYQESTWRQFDANGNPLISPDNGYGIMQVTSVGSYDVEKLKYDIDYNIAAGADILLEKWSWVPSIGDDSMDCYENWFYAVWAYNGMVTDNPYPYQVWAHIAAGRNGWWAGVPVTAPLQQPCNPQPYGGCLPPAIPTPQPAHYWTPPLDNYFSWYDGVYSNNWVLVANPQDAAASVAAGVAIAGVPKDLSPFALPGQSPGVVPPGKSIAARFPGLLGGPVRVNVSREAIISQRILFGDSIEEVVSRPWEELSSHYYWPWYDMESPGYKNWVLINNPNDTGIYYVIRLDGEERGSGELSPGQTFTPTLDGEKGGPLEVEAWLDEGHTAAAPVIASQRVLSGSSFNEAPGIPAESLASDYYWPWYDGIGGRNWVLLANPNPATVDYQIEIGAGGCGDPSPAGTACSSGTLAAAGDPGEGDIVTPEFTGVRNGPVRVTSQGGHVIASQRVVFGPSFGETAGYPAGRLGNDYHWTWYDQLSAGMKNWVLVANPSATEPVTYTIRINGQVPPGYAGRNLAPGQIETPMFPGWRGGPVEVVASGPVLTSQRVLYKGYFNEVTGTLLGSPAG